MLIFSSRPTTAATPVPEEYISSPQKHMNQSVLEVKDIYTGERSEVAQLIYHQTDFSVSTIVDNPKVCTLFCSLFRDSECFFYSTMAYMSMEIYILMHNAYNIIIRTTETICLLVQKSES